MKLLDIDPFNIEKDQHLTGTLNSSPEHDARNNTGQMFVEDILHAGGHISLETFYNLRVQIAGFRLFRHIHNRVKLSGICGTNLSRA